MALAENSQIDNGNSRRTTFPALYYSRAEPALGAGLRGKTD